MELRQTVGGAYARWSRHARQPGTVSLGPCQTDEPVIVFGLMIGRELALGFYTLADFVFSFSLLQWSCNVGGVISASRSKSPINFSHRRCNVTVGAHLHESSVQKINDCIKKTLLSQRSSLL